MLKFELSAEMLAIIDQALGNAPYRIAAPVLAELQRQINEQQPKSTAVPKDGNGISAQRIPE